MKILESAAMVEQFRFPKSKGRRIRKKWSRNKINWRPMQHFLRYGDDYVICHPTLAARLRRTMRASELGHHIEGLVPTISTP